jgi:hypothetical protein
MSMCGEMHEQLLHRVGSGRPDGFEKALPFEGEHCTRYLVRDPIGFG